MVKITDLEGRKAVIAAYSVRRVTIILPEIFVTYKQLFNGNIYLIISESMNLQNGEMFLCELSPTDLKMFRTLGEQGEVFRIDEVADIYEEKKMEVLDDHKDRYTIDREYFSKSIVITYDNFDERGADGTTRDTSTDKN